MLLENTGKNIFGLAENVNFYLVDKRNNNTHLLTFVHCCVFDK